MEPSQARGETIPNNRRWIRLTKDKVLYPIDQKPTTIKTGQLLRTSEAHEKLANMEWAMWDSRLIALFPSEFKYVSLVIQQDTEEGAI